MCRWLCGDDCDKLTSLWMLQQTPAGTSKPSLRCLATCVGIGTPRHAARSLIANATMPTTSGVRPHAKALSAFTPPDAWRLTTPPVVPPPSDSGDEGSDPGSDDEAVGDHKAHKVPERERSAAAKAWHNRKFGEYSLPDIVAFKRMYHEIDR